MVIGKQRYSNATGILKLGSKPVEQVDSWRYLGFHLTSGKQLGFSVDKDLCSYYRSSNCIINTLYKPSEQVLLQLFYTNCVSILNYGCEVKEFLSRDMCKQNVAINDGIRKFFG
jgi:hypothetical protein